MQPIILVHGGAGKITTDKIPGKLAGVKLAVKEGYKILKNGGSIVDAVEKAVNIMEEDEHFNCGYGSVLNLDGEVEMDASIMVGSTLNAGGVTVVKDIKYPISLARRVMENTPHVLLAGAGAQRFAKEQGFPILPPGSLVTENARRALKSFISGGAQYTEIGSIDIPSDVGTVGAVAIDTEGHVVAATSTGGINGKMVGRSSDTSLLGSGTYADDESGAVSTTGHGETIAKFCLSHSIIRDLENGKTAQAATKDSIIRMTKRLNNTAGAITLSKIGEIGVYFSSERMAWAYQKGNEVHYGIEHDQDEVEIAD